MRSTKYGIVGQWARGGRKPSKLSADWLVTITFYARVPRSLICFISNCRICTIFFTLFIKIIVLDSNKWKFEENSICFNQRPKFRVLDISTPNISSYFNVNYKDTTTNALTNRVYVISCFLKHHFYYCNVSIKIILFWIDKYQKRLD